MSRGNRSYEYQPPTYEQAVDRAERKTMFDPIFKDVKIYRPKQGPNLIRILPPGWRSRNNHYGLVVSIHRDVGPNDRQYLCLKENPTSPHKRCPICEELYALGARATQEDRNLLRPKESVVFYIIDRDNEKEGVQVWLTSGRTDSEIAAQMTDHRTKSVIDIVHPEDGYDIEFTRTGTTRNNTQYRGYRVVRHPSPLSDNERQADEWMDLAFDRPLPSILNFYSPEHIESVFYGKVKEEGTQDDRRSRDDDESRNSRRAAEPEDEGRPLRRTRSTEEDELPSRSRGSRGDEEEGGRRPRIGDDDGRDRDEPRSRRAERDDRDDARDDTEDRSRRPARDRSPSDDADEGRPPRDRSRLSRELDDEVPSNGGRRARPNGRDEEGSAEREQRGRSRDDEGEDELPRRRRPPAAEEEGNRHESRRERLRERLDREE